MSGATIERAWSLVAAGAGWRLDTGETAGGWRTTAERGGWIAEDGAGRRARLERLRPAGFAAFDEAGEELARTDAPLGMERDTRLRHLLLADGRLFRVVRGAGREPGFELLGWETPGAYLEARPVADGWRLARTPAGRGLERLDAAALLFCMEIVDAEGGTGTDVQ